MRSPLVKLLLPVCLLFAAPAFAAAVSTAGTVKTTKIWSAPSDPRQQVGTLKKGDRLSLKSQQPGWYEVLVAPGKGGWVKQQFTELVADAPEVPRFTHRPVSSVAEIPNTRPGQGAWRIHLIDVGTGLSVLVQGSDFTLLFDGGSKDDKAGISDGKSTSRLLAYLAAALGGSGPKECSESGTFSPASEVVIDHLVMSHPHDDHGNLLDEVLRCYKVKEVWDSGRINDTVFYREFLEQVSAEKDVIYHTAASPPSGDNRKLVVSGVEIAMPKGDKWKKFEERNEVKLGESAKATVLHADAEAHSDPNSNSIVLRLDLGSTSVLLTGDSESGARLDPLTGPLDDVELELVTNHGPRIDVDILQVGHHGSMTSSRKAFIDAVTPKLALIGAGPYKYSGIPLPDKEVVAALKAAKADVLITNTTDGKECPSADRVGQDNARPGGCDNFIIEVGGP